MKLMLLIPTNGSGGAEHVMSVVGGWMAERGHDVCVVNLDEKTNFYSYPSTVRQIKLGVDYTGPNGEPAPGNYLRRAQRDFAAFDRVIRQEKPDAALVFLNMAESFGSLALLKNRVPFAVSIRNDPAEESRPLKLVRKFVLPRCQMLICQSEKVRVQFADKVRHTCVIPNPLADDAVSPLEPVAAEAREKVVLNVGRLNAQKNQMLLLDAFAHIASQMPEVKLRLVGGGELEQPLKKRCAALGLTERVEFTGRVKSPLQKYRDAGCFVLSSDFEGFPNVLVEAMANGIPSISTDFPTGAAREVIQDGESGCLVPCGDAAALAEKMKLLLSDPHMQDKFSAAGAVLRERFSRQAVCSAWEQALENVAGKS